MKLDIARTSYFRCLCPHRQQHQGIVVCEDTDNGGKYSLSANGEERVVGRSKERVSYFISETAWTHPDIAPLVDPLFAARKEGKVNSIFISLNNPLCAKGEERVAHIVPRGESPVRIQNSSAISYPVFARKEDHIFICSY